MKKVTEVVNGKKISVYVDDKTAEVLLSVDEEMCKEYVRLEYEAHLIERKETRRHNSLDAITESGKEFVSDEDDIADCISQAEDKQNLYKAISILDTQQKWLVQEVVFNGRGFTEIGRELGISEQAVYARWKVILKKLKKFLEK